MKKKEFIKSLSNPPYEMRTIDTSVLIIPRDTYQRPLQSDEVKEICRNALRGIFPERKAENGAES